MILRYDQGMNTHPEPIDPNRPAVEDIAREVLAAEKVMDDTPGLLYLDGPTREHEEAAGAILATAPDLARAVIDMTATIKRVEALADDMDHDADLLDQTDDLRLHLIAATHREDATRLRAALNGENHA